MTALPDEVTQTTRVSSYALIVQDGRILLCRLSGKMSTEKGRWTLPGGGIEFGESPESALVRELQEETGYEIEVRRLMDIHSDVFNNPESRVHVIRILFEARIIGGEMRSEADGSTDLCEWIPLEKLPELPIVEVVRRGARLLRKKRSRGRRPRR